MSFHLISLEGYNTYMFNLLIKTFVKDYENTSDAKVRAKYGTVCSIFSIICNGIMVAFKLLVSYITGSVSIMADGLNNLSDMASNLATLLGFRLSNKHPDSDHPYGHGRLEYVSGMIIAFLVIMMGISAIKEAAMKLIDKTPLTFSGVAIIVLIVSILIKLLMAYINKKAGNRINSEALKAAGQDSVNDSLMTSATLVCLILFKYTNIDIDAYVAIVVSVLVLVSGIKIFKDVLDTILGKAPDKELLKQIEEYILSNGSGELLGIHDVMVHDYGPSSTFMSLHVEVDASKDIFVIHDTIDNIERGILDKFNILATIHMDPVDIYDEERNVLKEMVKNVVKDIDSNYSIHDFRIVKGPTHINLVFDLLIPAEDKNSHEEIRKIVTDRITQIDKKYYCVINVEHSFC